MYYSVDRLLKGAVAAIVGAVVLVSGVVAAQPAPRGERVGEILEQRRGIGPGRFALNRFGQPNPPVEDEATTGPRGWMKWGGGLPEDLKNVPALDTPLREMLEIHQERLQLARQRQAIALDRSRPSGEIVKEFHELLRREDELTSRQRTVLAGLLKNLDSVQEQVARRREALRREMELAAGGEVGEGRSAPDSRRLWRALRFYDMIGPRLEVLARDPDRPDALRMLLRGGFETEGLDPAGAETLRVQLREVRQQQERLQRKMQELEQQIDEISDVLAALEHQRVGPPAAGPTGSASDRPGAAGARAPEPPMAAPPEPPRP